MGNGSSLDSSKTIYLSIAGKTEKIVLSRLCGSRDIHDLIAQAAGVSRYSEITLRDSDGALIPISPSMAKNLPSSPYEVTTTTPSLANAGDGEAFKQVLTHVTEQFTQSPNMDMLRVFKVDEMKLDLTNRINVLERRLELEGLKAVEIEKCRRDISDIKYQILNSQKKVIDFNSMSALSDERKISLKRDVPLYPKYTLSQETVNYLKQPTFDIWDWEPNEMLSLLEHMYHELGLVTEFNINPITLKRWLLCVQENYRNNPFHNFRHCFCVTQMMYGMVHLCKLWEKMSREDLGVLLTSCICHDLDHPGYNNTYQINARTELAIRYNDISPLENHHCAVAFKILSNPECNIFANTDKEVYKRIRAEMLVLILATDMAKHKDIVEKLRSLIPNFDYNDSDNVQALKMVLIKCCDISNEVRPMEVSDPWVDCLLEEYFNQSDREKMEGLPVAPFMDREKVTKPTAQIGFIKFVLIPMFETVAQLFPIIDKTMVEPLRIARDRYEHMKETSVPNTSDKKND